MVDFFQNSFIDPTRTESYPSIMLGDYSLITTYDTFSKLTFWNKLEFVRHTSDAPLLNEVFEKVESKQLQASALHRLIQLEQANEKKS